MKYFKNISTPEELKKQFRQYCITMHPDKGGNAAEFAHMFAEYRQAAKNCGAWTKETCEKAQGVRRGGRCALSCYKSPPRLSALYCVIYL